MKFRTIRGLKKPAQVPPDLDRIMTEDWEIATLRTMRNKMVVATRELDIICRDLAIATGRNVVAHSDTPDGVFDFKSVSGKLYRGEGLPSKKLLADPRWILMSLSFEGARRLIAREVNDNVELSDLGIGSQPAGDRHVR